MSQKPFAPAAQRNRQPILDVLRAHLPSLGTVLEVASGTGQHVEFFAAHMPDHQWIPSECDVGAVATLSIRLAELKHGSVAPPLVLDVAEPWPEIVVDAVVTANLLHVSPPATIEQLCRGAAGVCRPAGILEIYGPFKQAGQHTSEGNAAFDVSLKTQHPDWGIRDLEVVVQAALSAGFRLREQIAMPANNLSLVFERQ